MNCRTIIRIEKLLVIELLLIIPFFKLLSIGCFIEEGIATSFFTTLGSLLDIMRIISATVGFGIMLFRLVGHKIALPEFSSRRIFILLVIYFVLVLVSCIINHSLTIKYAMKIYTYIGFVVLCYEFFILSPLTLIKSCKIFFGSLCIAGMFFIFLYPLGFNHGDRVYTAIYLFGGKNTAFPFYFFYLFTLVIEEQYLNKANQKKIIILLVIMICCAIKCESVNTLLSIMLFGVIYLLYKDLKITFNPFIINVMILSLLLGIYIGPKTIDLTSVLGMFNRNMTFSKRTILWDQAYGYFHKSPLFGAGDNIVYRLSSMKNGFTDHAHSQYIDRVAKYGIIPMIFLISIIISTVNKIKYPVSSRFSRCLGVLFSVYTLHMGFDDYNFNFFILLVMLTCFYSSDWRNFILLQGATKIET